MFLLCSAFNLIIFLLAQWSNAGGELGLLVWSSLIKSVLRKALAALSRHGRAEGFSCLLACWVSIFGPARCCQPAPLLFKAPATVEFRPFWLFTVCMPPVFEAAGSTSNSHAQRMPSKDLFSLDMSVADGRKGSNKDFSATIVIYPLKKKKRFLLLSKPFG